MLFATPACLTVVYLPHVNNSSILASLTVFIIFWSTLITSILAYRVSPWHPLAQYPGPLICKFTKFYLAFLSLHGKQYLYYSQLHKKYGDVVRIGTYYTGIIFKINSIYLFGVISGPNELSICNLEAVIPLMGPQGLEKGPCKLGFISKYIHFSFVIVWSGRVPSHEAMPLETIVDKTEHTRRRQFWIRGFTISAIKGYEGFVKNRSLQLIETLASKNLKDTQNLTEWSSFFSYDLMMDLAYVIQPYKYFIHIIRSPFKKIYFSIQLWWRF